MIRALQAKLIKIVQFMSKYDSGNNSFCGEVEQCLFYFLALLATFSQPTICLYTRLSPASYKFILQDKVITDRVDFANDERQ